MTLPTYPRQLGFLQVIPEAEGRAVKTPRLRLFLLVLKLPGPGWAGVEVGVGVKVRAQPDRV
ncbi:hypothetical protein, partial [Mycobacterium riyadhense]|uniref:hypothetical protein n=1 Tax=Mycobacterium riyadhense TaxID=486698 RepID=UPI001B8004B1